LPLPHQLFRNDIWRARPSRSQWQDWTAKFS